MFDDNDAVYRWARTVAGELSAAGNGEAAEKLRSSLFGATSGEVLGALLKELGDIAKTSALETVGRDREAKELICLLRKALHLPTADASQKT